MFRERKHLQELPSSSGNLPKWTQLQETKKTHKVPFEDNCENECTPQDLIQSWSPPQKRPRICNGKENEDVPFVLARRPRKKRESEAVISWDSLPDELLLRIFHGLPLVDLLKVSQVCKRWHRLAFDESLWHSVDLTRKALLAPALSQVLTAGVVALRCPRTCIGKPSLKNIRCLAQNPELLRLNMSGCSGFSAHSLGEMLHHCTRLDELNLSWCEFTSDHVKAAVNNIPESVTQLNLSGYRQNLHIAGMYRNDLSL
ncbi:S-phase kinase-associated protein 2 [Acipenser ruthenus]|uniref:S-phase kinase-associated protein 2 n=1 Tax=Acipenser ruthenus TaxID=7906 RepID=A0A444V5E7_ACIRT|nr:S-phase kinase-associated protein 2 [Acipenser ruthenus]